MADDSADKPVNRGARRRWWPLAVVVVVALGGVAVAGIALSGGSGSSSKSDAVAGRANRLLTQSPLAKCVRNVDDALTVIVNHGLNNSASTAALVRYAAEYGQSSRVFAAIQAAIPDAFQTWEAVEGLKGGPVMSRARGEAAISRRAADACVAQFAPQSVSTTVPVDPDPTCTAASVQSVIDTAKAAGTIPSDIAAVEVHCAEGYAGVSVANRSEDGEVLIVRRSDNTLVAHGTPTDPEAWKQNGTWPVELIDALFP